MKTIGNRKPRPANRDCTAKPLQTRQEQVQHQAARQRMAQSFQEFAPGRKSFDLVAFSNLLNALRTARSSSTLNMTASPSLANSLRTWECKLEYRPRFGVIRTPNLPAMGLDDGPADGQAQAHPVRLASKK